MCYKKIIRINQSYLKIRDEFLYDLLKIPDIHTPRMSHTHERMPS